MTSRITAAGGTSRQQKKQKQSRRMTTSFLSICLVAILPHAVVQGFNLQPVTAFAGSVRFRSQQQLSKNGGSFTSRHGATASSSSALFSSSEGVNVNSDNGGDNSDKDQVFDADRQFALSRIKTHKTEKDDPEWKFFDTARIHVSGGDGGTGCVAFRREKGESRGGPYGGRGGRGGSVFLEAVETLNTLMPCRQRVHVRGAGGKRGSGKNRDGCHGDDIIIPVPPGTLVRDLKTQRLAGELREPGDKLLVAKGGRGGRGNAVRFHLCSVV
jgi:hypothetical protein